MPHSLPRQKWLILAYIFNVDGKAASQTITDRIPLLLQNKISLTVLSGPTGQKDTRFPHHRIFSCMPSGLQYELRFLLKQKKIPKILRELFKGLLTIILLPLYLIERIFIHLDTHWSWGISGTFFGFFVLLRYRPDIIYSTAGPSSTHFTGYLLHKISGIPWMAEIHDPLVYDTRTNKWYQRFLFKNWLEKKICSKAAAVIYFTEHALDSANRRHPIKNLKTVIRPGAAPPQIEGIVYTKRNKMHIGHFGSLASTRNLIKTMEALNLLLQEHSKLQDNLILDIYGSGLDNKSKKAVDEFPIAGILQEHGRLEYDPISKKTGRQQVIEAMTLCDVQLLLHGSGLICDEYIPSKVYEYLLTGRPVLALTTADSELSHIIQESGHLVADPDDVKAIRDALLLLITRWENNQLATSTTTPHYTIGHTVQKLLNIAEQIT